MIVVSFHLPVYLRPGLAPDYRWESDDFNSEMCQPNPDRAHLNQKVKR